MVDSDDRCVSDNNVNNNTMNKEIEQGIVERLDIIKDIQDVIPNCHVGGSIGLYLHGIKLQREYNRSDIDLVIDEEPPKKFQIMNRYTETTSNPNDFDYRYRSAVKDGLYIKVDIRISPEPSFVVINFMGIDYNVSKQRDILFWKQKYADKWSEKHIADLNYIDGGNRPLQPVYTSSDGERDDLPF